MYFFGLSFTKHIYSYYNFYLLLSLRQLQTLTVLNKKDDFCNYDFIVLMLNNFKSLVDCFGEDSLIFLKLHYIIRNLSQGLCLLLSLRIFNFKTNTGLFYYKSLDFFEREAWDMFGIVFNNHPNLTRILSDYGFVGFPLRKEFPLTGFYESFYNGEHRFIENRKIFLKQDFNYFTNTTWLY